MPAELLKYTDDTTGSRATYTVCRHRHGGYEIITIIPSHYLCPGDRVYYERATDANDLMEKLCTHVLYSAAKGDGDDTRTDG